MSGFNVFNWIRDGVRQSVLLGVSDALEQIGTTPDGEDGRARFQELVRRGELLAPTDTNKTESRPRRLGRSLKDLEGQ
ncbi:MAG: hypothetical protein ACKPEY_13595 [Planctomycetota bacterium]